MDLRRLDGRDLDCFLHVNPQLRRSAMTFIYNPLNQSASRALTLPLYHTGLTGEARIREQEGEPRAYRLDRKLDVKVPVAIPPKGVTWLLVEQPCNPSVTHGKQAPSGGRDLLGFV